MAKRLDKTCIEGPAPETVGGGASANSEQGPKRKGRHRFGVVDAFFGLVLLAGLGLLLYPTVADWVVRWNLEREMDAYDAEVAAQMAEGSTGADLDEAHAYNDELSEKSEGEVRVDMLLQELADAREYNEGLVEWSPWEITANPDAYADLERYESLLNPRGDGIMGYISIDSIDVSLPIYHGTSDAELQVGAGHLIGSSLPVGGPSTHAVIAAHSGLPSARMFDRLEELSEGDVIILSVLGQRLGYAVDSRQVVEPDEVEALTIEDGEDLVTLVTCTPYGVNTHRLLVRGHRVDLPEEELDALVRGARFPWWMVGLSVAAVVAGAVILAVAARRKGGARRRKARPRHAKGA